MAHGTRGRWLRVATTGFGMVLCTGLVGCMNTDKPKDKVAAKQPGPGLVGTPTLPSGAGAGAGAISKIGQPAGQYYGTTPGTGVQPAGGFQPGAGAGPTRFGSNGQNTNTSGQSQPYNYATAPGAPGIINAPTQPGYIPPSMQLGQPGQPVGASGAPSQYLGSSGTPGGTAYASPPNLLDMPLPPPPPMHGSVGGIESAGGVQPPVPSPSLAPMAPSMPPPSPTGSTGKQPLGNFVTPGVFGSQ